MTKHIILNQPEQAAGAEAAYPRRARTVAAGLAAVQLVLAYEWLVSGVNKLLNANFTVQLAGTLQQNMNGNPYGWFVSFLRQVVLPHAGLFGLLTELGELSIGITLAVSAVLWIRRPHDRLTRSVGKAACLALAGAVVLPLSFFFMSGDPLPWINPANAFNEGVSIDALIPLLALPLLVANLRAVTSVAGRPEARPAEMVGGRSWAA